MNGKSKIEIEIVKKSLSSDKTIKVLAKMPSDGALVEAVLIPFHKRNSVCLSTQVGCAMDCQFCATGVGGFKRNLSAEEIYALYQIFSQTEKLLPNVVLMGQGEPLQNFNEVKRLIGDYLMAPAGAGGAALGPRQITLSTVGLLPMLGRLKELPGINIALSLHSPFDEERGNMMPIARKGKYLIEDILAALDEIPLRSRQFINYEYLMVKDLNMTEAHAQRLSELLRATPERAGRSIVNLIAFNECLTIPALKAQFPYSRPNDEDIRRFKALLVERKLRTMYRVSKGLDIEGACGQLSGNSNK